MDFGIRGKRALVCAASKGLGRGVAEALAGEGVALVLNARGAEALEATAAEIRARCGVPVETVAADISTEEGRAAVLAMAGEVDILVTNAGGPPPGVWTDWDRDAFIAAFDANMLSAVALMQALVPGMMARGWGRVVNITSRAVKAPLPALGLSTTARTGLTGFVAGMARQVAGSGVTVNNLLPGSHDTDRLRGTDARNAGQKGITVEAQKAARLAANPVGRDGTPQEFGAVCAFLCSQQAAFMVGQNVLVDGGEVNATF
ncbi:SDR family oxidoreductase [Sinisalibacter aestuarii]|uniref:3-oxoacyl-ACP reductase n=1 Tax=Sinisalibacter aestuarii TaxID=2949426 RepID=A0ABQ5LSV4_9RHOB|nr:SDR family oxidoreductase [Sinisalibacter aestuarii]GKY87823.1 3-oxoacyl-ACP reductase [Sinisalibacter aestuarii]